MTAPAFDVKDAISEAVSSALSTTAEEQPQVVSQTAEEDPIADDEEEAPDDVVAQDTAQEDVSEEEEEPIESDAITLPEGFVTVPTVEDGLATEFRLLDAEGEVEVPALVVEYKANGKVRQDRLDQVVKLAQWGVYSQERETRLKQETEQRVQSYEQLLEEREAQMERLLSDDDYRERVYEAYLAENSPERRAERAEEQITNLRLQQELQTIEQYGTQFLSSEVEPALQLISTALPTITREELESKLEMAMLAHVEIAPNGAQYVPPSRYEAIRKYITEDLAIWAQAVHNRRNQPAAPKEDPKAKAELERARVEAQRAKRLVGQKTKPVGKAGPSADKPKATQKPSTVDDAMRSAMDNVMTSLRS